MTTGAPDHFKRILLYGLYNGAATPLACDEQGRLILVTEPVSPFGKSGTVLIADDFSDGLIHVKTATSGTGAAVELEDSEALRGGYSCKLTGGSDANQTASVLWYCFPSAFNKLGMEFAVRFASFTEIIRLDLAARDGTDGYRGQLRYNHLATAWQIYDPGAADWVDILSGFIFSEAAHEFLGFKLVIDWANGRYGSFRYAGGLVDISSYALETISNDMYPRAYGQIEVKALAGGTGWSLIDNVIITQDES